MEALAIVAIVSSIVQLVDFSSKCVSGSIELHRSADGILDENRTLELTTNELLALNSRVENAAVSASDSKLQDLCKLVSGTAGQLLGALGKLRVEPGKSKWRSVRKALRSVWSKDELVRLEGQLARARDELNLYIVVDIKQQLEENRRTTASNFTKLDDQTKQILDSIISNGDIFQDQSRHLLKSLEQSLKDVLLDLKEANDATRSEFFLALKDAGNSSQRDHELTRDEIHSWNDELTSTIVTSNQVTNERIASSTVEVSTRIDLSESTNREQHESTQRQISELQEALRVLNEQIQTRNEELKGLLSDFNKTNNKKKRQHIGELSSAVTAALLALETMFQTLQLLTEFDPQAVLKSLQNGAREMVHGVRSATIVRFLATSQKADFSLPIGFTKPLSIDDGYRIYLSYFYNSAYERAERFVNMHRMAEWQTVYLGSTSSGLISRIPHIDGLTYDMTFCQVPALWLLSAVACVITHHVTPKSIAFTLISTAFDHWDDHQWEDPGPDGTRAYSSGSRANRLKVDIEYWTWFALQRGMDSKLSEDTFAIEQTDQKMLQSLVTTMLGDQRRTLTDLVRIYRGDEVDPCTQTAIDPCIKTIILSLARTGVDRDAISLGMDESWR
ncbi:hypothetical protein H2200_010810 [Cladophialophora chaetospira]|uniref:Fungal N-terminal domain-containing protein n=1 Tax=Cladophialophora chaetospira TaxID=386627 RepID=A0AA38X0S9_9EURO|nr:hypothetical protein H2200_010810 [Cladophialophora chaetospira]